MEALLQQIRLEGDTEFAQKFNIMNDLWQKYEETGLDEDFNNFWDYKFRLETGML
jgi:hypothetical protein